MRRPLIDIGTSVLDPEDRLTPVVGANEVESPVAVHVEREIGIVVIPATNLLDVPQEVFLPRGGLVPPSARDDIEPSVLIHINRRCGWKGRVKVDVMAVEGRVSGEERWRDKQ
ncbi:MAG: hypothetical protein R3B91_14735 [Planctomycetaceae bacterium]